MLELITRPDHSRKVSVVIPCFNAENSIESTLQSVLQQCYTNFDVIIIDDGSTDQTVMKVWALRDAFNQRGVVLHIISQKNAGVSAARNRGVAESTADYIAFLDADDRWATTKLTEHVQFMQSNAEVGISFARVRFIDEPAQPTGVSKDVAEKESAEKRAPRVSSLPMGEQNLGQLFAENPTCTTSNLVVQRAIFNQVGGFDTTMSFAEDQEFLVRVLCQTRSQVVGVDAILADYQLSTDGLSANLMSMYFGWRRMVKKVRDYAPEFVEREFDRSHARYCRYLARRSLRLKDSVDLGWRFAKMALASDRSLFLQEPVRSIPVLGLSYLRRAMQDRIQGQRQCQEHDNSNHLRLILAPQVSIITTINEVNHG